MAKPDILHATAVAVGARGLLITGASGSGKSTLALQLIALGATLVADDKVIVTPTAEGAVRLSAPTATKGLIEARGLGLLRTDVTSAYVAAVVTLDETETRRLPQARETVIAGTPLPLLARVESAAFPAMLVAYLKGGRAAP